MVAFWTKYKGYIIHGAAIAVVFLSPTVSAFLLAHPIVSAFGAGGWGWLLHWADGK